VNSGGWYEHATRGVDSSFLESPTVSGSSQFAILGETQEQLGRAVFDQIDKRNGEPSFMRKTENDATREIWAWYAGSKATLWERWDLLGGVRLENIFIDSRNQPFTGDLRFGAPATFPEAYLFFDQLDNPQRRVGGVLFPEVSTPPPPGSTFNGDLLGIDRPATPCPIPSDPGRTCVDLVDRASILSLVNGEIDELHVLPTAGFAVRPLEGVSVKGAWSQTVARPSFREMGFYVSVEPASDDLIVGNPQLKLSPVDSYDLRTEYVFGDFADLVALSGFYKTIDEPIESIVIRNPLNFEQSSSALYRTFFNNPSQAKVWGIEVETRKNLGFVGDLLGSDGGDYFTIGANYTYIHARVDRIAAELTRAQPFFGTRPGDSAEFSSLDSSRRLFGQPEWIVNADITFDQPDWGTKATLAFYAISDVLDAAGSAFIGPNNVTQSLAPDRYIDSYGQLDLIVSQEIWSGLTFSVQMKNLTNSTRRIVYDPYQTSERIPEREIKVGRDFKFQLKYSF
jgi:outer membrane receptor protein involved in Fe transport